MAKQRMMDSTLSGSITLAVGYWKRLSWDGANAGTIDVTDVSSTGFWKEFLAGLKDAGNITIAMQFEKAIWTKLHTALGVVEVWTLTLGDGSKVVASGFVTQAPGFGGELESGADADVNIKLTGVPVYTPIA